MRVISFMAHISDNCESFMLEGIKSDANPEMCPEFYDLKFKSDKLGHLLTSLLNLEFSVVKEIVSRYEWAPDADDCLDPPTNIYEIHRELFSISDIFNIYPPEEWFSLRCDFECYHESAEKTINQIKKYLDFCNRHQESYSGPFFDFLIMNNYFSVDPSVLCPVEERHSVDDLFDDDDNMIDDLDEIYATFINGNTLNYKGVNAYIFDNQNRLGAIAIITLNEIGNRGKVIRTCQNCGRYFIPDNRSDTLYCDNLSPQDQTRTCKQYGSQRLWYERQKNDELATLSRNILSAKSMLAKRNPDIPEYSQSYDYFRDRRKIWKSAVKEGSKTREEYQEWLILMQSQKVIKEAISGNDGE